jgi:hypothetical protein
LHSRKNNPVCKHCDSPWMPEANLPGKGGKAKGKGKHNNRGKGKEAEEDSDPEVRQTMFEIIEKQVKEQVQKAIGNYTEKVMGTLVTRGIDTDTIGQVKIDFEALDGQGVRKVMLAKVAEEEESPTMSKAIKKFRTANHEHEAGIAKLNKLTKLVEEVSEAMEEALNNRENQELEIAKLKSAYDTAAQELEVAKVAKADAVAAMPLAPTGKGKGTGKKRPAPPTHPPGEVDLEPMSDDEVAAVEPATAIDEDEEMKMAVEAIYSGPEGKSRETIRSALEKMKESRSTPASRKLAVKRPVKGTALAVKVLSDQAKHLAVGETQSSLVSSSSSTGSAAGPPEGAGKGAGGAK